MQLHKVIPRKESVVTQRALPLVLVVLLSISMVVPIIPAQATIESPIPSVIEYNYPDLPAGAQFNEETGEFFWHPSPEQIGNHIIRFSTHDPYGASDYEDITVTVHPAPVVAPDDEIVNKRTRTSKTYWLGGNQYSLINHIGSIHYQDIGGYWQDIETDILPSSRPNWDWEVTRGSWTLLIRDDTTVAIKKGTHWIGFRYGGMAYIDWQSKERIILANREAVTPVVTGDTITWPGIFGQETSLRYIYQGDRFKEELVLSQGARNWLTNNPPSSYGLNNQTSYLGGYLEMDWSGAPVAEREDGTLINWNTANEFINARVLFRDPVTRKIISALPLDYVYPETSVEDVDFIPIRKRFWVQNGNHYLIFGAKVTDIVGLPDGNLIFDPTIDQQVGASLDDAFSSGASLWNAASKLVCSTNWGAINEVFLRWSNVSIPPASQIDVAYFTVTNLWGAGSGNPITITGLDEDDVGNFPDHATAHGYSQTSASVGWTQGAQSNNVQYQSPSIVSIIQEIVDRPGYASSHLGIRTDADEGTVLRHWYDWDNDSSKAVELHIEYTVFNPPSPFSATYMTDYNVTLEWTHDGMSYAFIRSRYGSYPTGLTDGRLVYNGTGTSYSDVDVDLDVRIAPVYYRAWGSDGAGQYSAAFTNATAQGPGLTAYILEEDVEELTTVIDWGLQIGIVALLVGLALWTRHFFAYIMAGGAAMTIGIFMANGGYLELGLVIVVAGLFMIFKTATILWAARS